MTQVSTNYRNEPQYRNTLTTALVCGATWGGMEYLLRKKPYLDKNDGLKDSFVKNMEEALVKINDSETLKTIEIQKNLEKEIDALTTSDELKEYIKKHKKTFSKLSEKDRTLLENEIGKLERKRGKEFLKGIFKADGPYSKHFEETLQSCYDEAGKLKHDASKISKEKWDAIKSVIKDARVKSALKAGANFATIMAVIGCAFEHFYSRKN